jgi:hypothetical protein
MARGTVSWTDLSADGRRLERIIKLCETKIATNSAANNDDLTLAYIDRLIKASHQKERFADLILGISHLRKVAEKKLDQPKVYLK